MATRTQEKEAAARSSDVEAKAPAEAQVASHPDLISLNKNMRTKLAEAECSAFVLQASEAEDHAAEVLGVMLPALQPKAIFYLLKRDHNIVVSIFVSIIPLEPQE